MANGNEVQIVGNITRDPELRYTNSGVAIAKFGLAYNHRRFNNQTKDWDEEVNFFDVVAWKELAENITASLGKGSRVVVLGRLNHNTWETDEGEKRSKVEIVADEVSPSLRWATATVTRNERNGDAPASSKPAASDNTPPLDEEPF